MAAPTGSSLWIEEAFLLAKNEFLKGLVNKSGFDFSKVSSADDVIDAAIAIQQQQAKTKTFRGLARIKPFITVLQDYSGVVDTFAQVKPDVLCLIWVSAVVRSSNVIGVLQLIHTRGPSNSYCRRPAR